MGQAAQRSSDGIRIEAFRRESSEKLLLLGDILYHGPRNDLPKEYAPKEVIAMLNPLAYKLLCVRGNCDTEVDQMVLDFPVLAEYAILYVGKRMIFATHGHNFNPANPPKIRKGDILLNGHTHVPAFEVTDNFTYVNPGSVSNPKENSEHGYIILEDSKLVWKNFQHYFSLLNQSFICLLNFHCCIYNKTKF